MDKKPSKFKKIIISILIIVLVVALISFFGLRSYYNSQMAPMAVENIKDITVEIPQGSSTVRIASILKDRGLIRNELFFRYTAKTLGLDGSLKAGKYVLNNGMTPEEILESLQTGGILKETVSFTIPEGFELHEIISRLSDMGLIDKVRFEELVSNPKSFEEKYPILKDIPEGLNLEGYLYPDTYEIFVDAKEEDIIEKMLSRFTQVYSDEIANKANDLNMTLNEVISLASIIEREGKLDEERPMISAVFHNRLSINQPLESCATIQFALGERKQVLSYKDLEIESDYNTYRNSGLPPGPIASPGKKSIEAAVNPADVPYKYFVSNEDGTGSHTFSITYQDHLNAIDRIRNK
nr:endolytic transglycosylase MltG [Sporosalibacterium faouarense]